MPNWCFTEYRCCGNKGELVDLKEKLDHLNSLPEPLVENGFGKLWCGCLVSLSAATGIMFIAVVRLWITVSSAAPLI